MLVWDLFKCHFTDAAKSQLQKSKSIVVAIPSGCIKIVHPAKVCWNVPFKPEYRNLYSSWMEGQHDLTPAGNMRDPSKQLMVQWVVSAWEAVTTETIVRSFEACGIISWWSSQRSIS